MLQKFLDVLMAYQKEIKWVLTALFLGGGTPAVCTVYPPVHPSSLASAVKVSSLEHANFVFYITWYGIYSAILCLLLAIILSYLFARRLRAMHFAVPHIELPNVKKTFWRYLAFGVAIVIIIWCLMSFKAYGNVLTIFLNSAGGLDAFLIALSFSVAIFMATFYPLAQVWTPLALRALAVPRLKMPSLGGENVRV